MDRNEKLLLIRDVPAAIIDALDGVMETQGLVRVALREIEEDWTPLLADDGGPLVFVLSQPKDEWTACFSSLAPDAEWDLCAALAIALEQPTAYALLSDATDTSAYRYFSEGVLHEEYMPDEQPDMRLDAAALLDRLAQHDIPLDLIDDRTQGFGNQHLVVGYSRGTAHHDGMI